MPTSEFNLLGNKCFVGNVVIEIDVANAFNILDRLMRNTIREKWLYLRNIYELYFVINWGFWVVINLGNRDYFNY